MVKKQEYSVVWRTENISALAGEIITAGENYTISRDDHGGLLYGISGTIGVGISPTLVSGQITWKYTKIWDKK